jgi:hypothetical protein
VKRSLYDSEYDRVRREAGMKNNGRLRPEFPEDEETEAPRAARTEIVHDQEFKDRMAAAAVHQAERRAKDKAEGDRYSREMNERIARREYEVLGLTPPDPLISLALLKSLGWRVEHFGIGGQERWELIRPASAPAPRSGSEV